MKIPTLEEICKPQNVDGAKFKLGDRVKIKPLKKGGRYRTGTVTNVFNHVAPNEGEISYQVELDKPVKSMFGGYMKVHFPIEERVLPINS